MIYRIAILLSFLIGVYHRSFAAGLSAETNGVYLAIAGWPHNAVGTESNAPVRFDSPIIFLPFCNTGRVDLSYPLDPAYALKVTMTDQQGKAVSKSRLGKRTGSKFDELHGVTETRVYPISAWGSYTNNEGLGGARFIRDYPGHGKLPQLSPKDLFEIKHSGIYTLEIQMQMFRLNQQNTNSWNRELFRFSPVQLEVVKP